MEGTQNNYHWVSYREGKVYALLTGSHWSVPVAQRDATCSVYQRTHRIWKAIAIINDAHLLFPPLPPVIGPRYNKKFEPVWRNAFSLKWWPPVSPVPPISVAPEIDSKCDNLAAARMLFFRISWEKLSHEITFKYEKTDKLYMGPSLSACGKKRLCHKMEWAFLQRQFLG